MRLFFLSLKHQCRPAMYQVKKCNSTSSHSLSKLLCSTSLLGQHTHNPRMLVIHYTEVSTLLIQEVALAPANWIGNINIPPGAPERSAGALRGGSGESRIMSCQHMCWALSICVMGPHSSTNIPLYRPGNQYSEGPHRGGGEWEKSGGNVPCCGGISTLNHLLVQIYKLKPKLCYLIKSYSI